MKWAACLLVISTLAAAVALSRVYGPVGVPLFVPRGFNSWLEVGQIAYDYRPSPDSKVYAIGLPRFDRHGVDVVKGYLQRARELGRTNLVPIIPAGADPNHEFAGTKVQEIGTDAASISALPEQLLRLQANGLQPVLIALSTASSHRVSENFIVWLEKRLDQKIGTLTLADIALTQATEPVLVPVCQASLRDGHGGTFDLGCLILTMSRKLQADHVRTDQRLVIGESEMPTENILAIYDPDSGK